MSKMQRCSFVAMILGLGAAQASAQCLVEQNLTASDAAAADEFGVSVSVSGDTAVVGAHLDDCAAGDFCGAAYVSRFDGSSWVEQQKLTATNAAGRDQFGYSVSVSGDTIIVGVPASSAAVNDRRGSAYVFRFDGTSWVEEQELTPSDATISDRFGLSVSVNGNTAVVGARTGCSLPGACGSAYVFRFNGFSWIEEQKLTGSSVRILFDAFGESVSVGTETIVVGSAGHDCTGDAYNNCGAAYVFRFNGASWVEEQVLIASDAGEGNLFGSSVSLHEDTLMVGAPSSGFAEGNCCGAAYVFRFNGDSWVEKQRLTAFDEAVRASFGQSVSVSGNTAAIGASRARGPDGCRCGSVYVFRFDRTSWVEQEKLAASGATDSDVFGTSVSVSGNTVIAGASWADCAAGDDCGSAFVFTCTPPRVVDLDIKPRRCPNRVDPRRSGAVPVAIVGSPDFDAVTVDALSLTLARADGVGETVSPLFGVRGRRSRGVFLVDVATPFVGEPCACHALGGDGIDDVLLQFSISDMNRELQLNTVRRGAVELVLRGFLLDGTAFEGSDCIRISRRARFFRK